MCGDYQVQRRMWSDLLESCARARARARAGARGKECRRKAPARLVGEQRGTRIEDSGTRTVRQKVQRSRLLQSRGDLVEGATSGETSNVAIIVKVQIHAKLSCERHKQCRAQTALQQLLGRARGEYPSGQCQGRRDAGSKHAHQTSLSHRWSRER